MDEPCARLASAVEALVVAAEQNNSVVADAMPELQELCESIEAVLKHGLLDKGASQALLRVLGYTKRASIADVLELAAGLVPSASAVLEQVRALDLRTSDGKGRALVRAALAEHVLDAMIEAVCADAARMHSFYEETAVLRVSASRARVLRELRRVRPIAFVLCARDVALDSSFAYVASPPPAAAAQRTRAASQPATPRPPPLQLPAPPDGEAARATPSADDEGFVLVTPTDAERVALEGAYLAAARARVDAQPLHAPAATVAAGEPADYRRSWLELLQLVASEQAEREALQAQLVAATAAAAQAQREACLARTECDALRLRWTQAQVELAHAADVRAEAASLRAQLAALLRQCEQAAEHEMCAARSLQRTGADSELGAAAAAADGGTAWLDVFIANTRR